MEERRYIIICSFLNGCYFGGATGVFAAGAGAGDAKEVEQEGGGLRKSCIVRTSCVRIN